ncbi:MAG: XRE family transcriptional regulator [Pseudomonadota bacterium]
MALSTNSTIGRDLRALRKSKGVTLQALSAGVGRSVGWLSQVERDITEPDIGDVEALTKALGVPLSLVAGGAAGPENETGRIVRAHARRAIGPDIGGLCETLASPDLTDPFEVVHSVFQPGATRTEPVRRATTELAFMVSGSLQVTIAGEAFTVNAGDSFRLRGEAFTWTNVTSKPAVALWVIAPPVY